MKLIEWDAAAPMTRVGVVTSVNTSTREIGLTLDLAWAGLGGAIYNLVFATYDRPLQATQETYAFMASATRRIDDGTGNERNAYEFAP